MLSPSKIVHVNVVSIIGVKSGQTPTVMFTESKKGLNEIKREEDKKQASKKLDTFINEVKVSDHWAILKFNNKLTNKLFPVEIKYWNYGSNASNKNDISRPHVLVFDYDDEKDYKIKANLLKQLYQGASLYEIKDRICAILQLQSATNEYENPPTARRAEISRSGKPPAS